MTFRPAAKPDHTKKNLVWFSFGSLGAPRRMVFEKQLGQKTTYIYIYILAMGNMGGAR